VLAPVLIGFFAEGLAALASAKSLIVTVGEKPLLAPSTAPHPMLQAFFD